ncbi:hypothetical protein [Mycobacterium sp.]|uniref:hypothetical protein n=1 Tax=Mycobacterium sp. TaxID=1785 RepID=UPI0025FC5ECB|nr:hypothetical protein [Mycobacterium sp.]
MSQPQQQQPSYPPPPAEPTFQVRTVKHTGALIFWMNQRFTTTGSYAQCEAAIDEAQQYCILLGWWSIASVLWNPISLSQNASARKALRLQAQQAHDYAVWWATYHGGGVAHTPIWAPPPARPGRRKWWVWLPLAVVGSSLALIIVIGALHGPKHHRHNNQWTPAPTLSTPSP